MFDLTRKLQSTDWYWHQLYGLVAGFEHHEYDFPDQGPYDYDDPDLYPDYSGFQSPGLEHGPPSKTPEALDWELPF